MAQLRQQYLDILQGYGVDPAGLRSATDAQLKRILQQTAQGRDIGGEMASGAAAGQQAAKDVIGGTTPVQSLESLLAAAHTGAPTASQAAPAADLPMSQATPTALDRDLRIRGDRTSMAVTGRSQEPTPVSTPLVPGWQPTEELVAEQHTLPAGKRVAAETADLPMSEATVQSIEQVEPRKEFGPTHSEYAAETERLGQLMKPDRTPMAITGRLQEPTPVSTPLVDEPALPAAPKQGILSRIGQYAKENPDIALAGMEGVGNLLANIGAARGQRKADEATQQGMARSNLISALTGGRVRPAVAEETPEMGLLGRVGQAVGTAGKLGREVEQERAARGFKEEEMQRKYDIKEAEVERKVADDVRKMMLAVGKNKLTDAQAEKVLADITLDMTAEDRKLYTTKWRERAEFAGLLVKQQAQSLAEQKWADQKVLQEQGQRLDQAYFDLSKEHKQELWQKWADELNIDKDRVKIDEDRAETYANQVKNEGEKIALQRAGEDRKRRREVMNIVKNNLNGDVLKKFMGSERGAFNTYQGLMAAWSDFESKPTSANMNGVFNMYQQLFDPATVREGDLELQRRGQGAFADAFAAGQRLFGEGFVLEQETIEEMKQVADMYYNDALEKERVKLDSYLEKFVAPEDAASIRAYYNTIWGAPQGAAAGSTGTADPADDYLEQRAQQAAGGA